MGNIVLRNDNKHTVAQGAVKLRRGQAGQFDDSDPDVQRIAGYGGVNTLEGDEADAALDKSRAPRTPTAESDLGNRLAVERGRINHLAVSAPLQVVVGDDAAPLGPPSGTITTKLGTDDPAHFAPNEATKPVPGDTSLSDGNANTVGDVHNAQHEGLVAADEVAQELIEQAEGDGSSREPSPEGLSALNKEGLVAEAARRGLPVSGSKAELEDRIRAHDAEHGAPADDPADDKE